MSHHNFVLIYTLYFTCFLSLICLCTYPHKIQIDTSICERCHLYLFPLHSFHFVCIFPGFDILHSNYIEEGEEEWFSFVAYSTISTQIAPFPLFLIIITISLSLTPSLAVLHLSPSLLFQLNPFNLPKSHIPCASVAGGDGGSSGWSGGRGGGGGRDDSSSSDEDSSSAQMVLDLLGLF